MSITSKNGLKITDTKVPLEGSARIREIFAIGNMSPMLRSSSGTIKAPKFYNPNDSGLLGYNP
ncbi:hypothetical protein [Methylorubrum populi]